MFPNAVDFRVADDSHFKKRYLLMKHLSSLTFGLGRVIQLCQNGQPSEESLGGVYHLTRYDKFIGRRFDHGPISFWKWHTWFELAWFHTEKGWYPSPNRSCMELHLGLSKNALNDHCQRTFSRKKWNKNIFHWHIGLPSECIKGFGHIILQNS